MSATLYGLEMAIDKLFINKSKTNYSRESIAVITTAVYLSVGILVIFIKPVNLTPPLIEILTLLGAGALFGGGTFLYFHAIKRESASKVGQLASLEAISTPIFAIVLLKETPSSEAAIAISLIVLGLFLLIFDRGTARAIATTKTAVIPILLAILLWSSQDVIIKIASGSQNVWTLFFWIRLGAFITISLVLLKKEFRTDSKELIRNYNEHTYYLILAGLTGAAGSITAITAISQGPLTIVSPIIASYSIFALLFSILLTKITSVEVHKTGNGYVAKRFISIILFLTGIALLSIT
jgi:drug/metabolite transporter (DMT)-like permease